MKAKTIAFFLLLLLLVAACRDDSPPADADIPTRMPAAAVGGESAGESSAAPGDVVISEVLIGDAGNNNYEFIEVYNRIDQTIDLRGFALYYQLPEQEQVRIYRWTTRTDLPPFGHVLLVREDQDVGALPDGTFDEGLFSKGRLWLVDRDEQVVDEIAWGQDAAGMTAGVPAPAPGNGESIERLPGGDAGNGEDSGDSAADFVVRTVPEPQNSGSEPTPAPAGAPAIAVETPGEVQPGDTFAYTVTVSNPTAETLENVVASVPVHSELTVGDLPAGAAVAGSRVIWQLPDPLPSGGSATVEIPLESPFTYFETIIAGAYAEAGGQRRYAALQPLAVGGGAIPIRTARGLSGRTVILEGTATMYTGGFFAGTTGTKFYLEDDTGGIQVYCPDSMGDLDVAIGDQIRLTGEIEIYRTSLEVIPCPEVSNIEIMGEGAAPEPAEVTLADAAGDPAVLGELIEVRGTITRLEEFNFSYEIDLVDEEGNSLLVYVDKLTEIDPAPLEAGNEYRVTGISEQWDGNVRLMPRVQGDFSEIFPPVLRLEVSGPSSAPPGATVTYTLSAINYTQEALQNVTLVTTVPEGDIISGTLTQDDTTWQISELASDGGRATVSYSFTIEENGSGTIALPTFVAGSQQAETVVPEPQVVYVGNGVPLWALQGSGPESPYARRTVAAEGIVTGVFPGLDGFWMQAIEPDGDPATSDAIFVQTEGLPLQVVPQDVVAVVGRVRELSGQTTLSVGRLADIAAYDRVTQLPAAVELDPPAGEAEAALYYEALEGMLVQVTQGAVAVAPTSQYGEYAVVLDTTGETRIVKGEEIGWLIFVDDGSAVTHQDQSTLEYAVYSGDRVSGLIGPLAYTFGNFKIQPITQPVVTPGDRALPPPLLLGANEFSIATYNAENLFDPEPPHPNDPPPPTQVEYELRLAKTADAIVTMGMPTIIAFQEVENIGVLEDLAERPELLGYDYEPVLIEGDDGRGIDVAYLIRGDQARVERAEAYPGPEGITSRHPLVVEVVVERPAGSATLFVINNHNTSLAGGEEATEPRRTAQAAWAVALAQQIQEENPDAYIAIVGDLNSFYDSLPIDTIREAGFIHVYEGRESEELYSYIFEGESETLDHILVTPNLAALIARVDAVHINADYPPAIPGDTSAQRASDHDPIVVTFTVP